VIDPDPSMRPGMSCSIEIKIDEIADALIVPVQSVVPSAGRQVVFVSTEFDTVEEREVTIGSQNIAWVQIVEGLEVGEVVMLSPPESYRLEPPAPATDSDGGDDAGSKPSSEGRRSSSKLEGMSGRGAHSGSGPSQ